jgi:hypothetical protein
MEATMFSPVLVMLTSLGTTGLAPNGLFPDLGNFLAAATTNTPGPGGTIVQIVTSFLPFAQMVQVVNACMPIFNLIAFFLIVIASVQEIPKHQGDGVFIVFLRGIVLIALISLVTPLMTQTELVAQSIVESIASASNPPATWMVNATVGDPQTSIFYNFTEPFSQISQFLSNGQSLTGDVASGALQGVDSPGLSTIPGGNIIGGLIGAAAGGAEYELNSVVILAISLVAAFTVFIMEIMLVIQKAILIFSRLFMPPFLGLLSWQGPTRFLGINFVQGVVGTESWPIGWAIGNIGTTAGLKNVVGLMSQLQSNSLSLWTLFFILINLFLICVWMVLVTVMGPMLIQRVVTAGGNFAGSMVGALAGKAIGAPAAALGAAGTAAGAALGSAGGLPGMAMGASIGGSLGGRLGGIGTSSLASAVSGATGDGGGGSGGGGGSAARAASAMYMAQMGRQMDNPGGGAA